MALQRIATSKSWRGIAATAALAVLAGAGAWGCGSSQKQTGPGASGTGDGPGDGAGDGAGGVVKNTAPVLLPVPSDPTVAYGVWFQVGSQNDPPGKEGLAWLTGRLVAEGSTTKHPYPEIVKLLFPMAASYDVRVDREMTTLTGRAHKDHVAAFQGLFADAYLRPAFAAEDIERLRNDGLNYLQKLLRYASDEELGKAALMWHVFEGTRYAHPVVGTVEGLKAITAEDIRSFYQTHYTRETAVFALGGGYDQATHDSFLATRQELPAAARAPAAAAAEPARFTGRHVLLVDKPGSDASISFGFPIDVRRGQDDYYALWLATSWLGEHRNSSSHLYEVIREKRGLNYGDYAYVEAFPEGGQRSQPPSNVARGEQIFEVWIRTLPNDKAIFALRAALRELRKLVDQGMTQEEFELTRSFLRKYVRHRAPTTQDQLGYAIDDRFYGLDQPYLDEFVRRMDALTVEDVNRAIKKHLQYKNLKIAIVTGEVDKLRTALTSNEPSPITYATEKSKEVMEEDKEIIVEPLEVPADNIHVVPVDQIFEK
jgi:zinc protease